MSTIAPHAADAPPAPQVSALEAYLDKNFRKIVYACIAAIAVSAIYGILKYRSHQAAVEAAAAATAAKTVDDCDIVIQKYKGSVAAGNALLTKAKLLWDQNKKDSAVATLRDFVGNYTDHPFLVQGQLALGTRLEAMGTKEAAEAKTIYEKIVNDHKDSEVAGLAQIRIADLLWSEGKEDEAKKIYDELPRKFIGQFTERVSERTEWIGAALPTKEVEGPKVPDALKAPATAPNAAPAINLTPGKNGTPLGTSAPFEVKAQPAGAASNPKPNIKLGAPPVAPSGPQNLKVEAKPLTPSAAPVAPKPADAKPATPPSAATSAPVPVPAAPVEPKKSDAK
jgi:predicted negative regulator of RcsB-dependent stress response